MFAAFLLLMAAEPTAAAPAPAVAAAPATSSQKPVKADPVVCETSQEVGSILRKKRTCMRRSEWRELRASNRQQIDRAQTQMPINGGG